MADDSAVEAYFAKQPEPQRAALERLRTVIRGVLPEAEETISYGIVGFRHRGKVVIWIAGWKKHVSIYPLDDTLVQAYADDLRGMEYGKGTLRFAPDAPPPDHVIEEFVRRRDAAPR